MPAGKIAARRAAQARWEADGGWAQVPAAAWSGTSRGVVNVSAGIGWVGATAASGYEQMILGTNHSGEFASALMSEAKTKNDGISQTVAGTTGVSVDGAAFKGVQQGVEFVTETALPVGAVNKAVQLNRLNKINGIAKGSLDNLSARKYYHQQLDGIAGKLDSSASMKDQARQAFDERCQI